MVGLGSYLDVVDGAVDPIPSAVLVDRHVVQRQGRHLTRPTPTRLPQRHTHARQLHLDKSQGTLSSHLDLHVPPRDGHRWKGDSLLFVCIYIHYRMCNILILYIYNVRVPHLDVEELEEVFEHREGRQLAMAAHRPRQPTHVAACHRRKSQEHRFRMRPEQSAA